MSSILFFFLAVSLLLFGRSTHSTSNNSDFSDTSYCNGDWHQHNKTSSTSSPYGDYTLHASRTGYDPNHSSTTVAKYLREACPAQQAGYSCYYTQPDKREHWEMLERRQYIPHNTSTCHPFTPHKFLHLLKNRRLLLLGDSVMGQTWESLVCALYNLPGLTTHLFTYFSQHPNNAHNPLLVPVPIDFSKLGQQNPLHGHILAGYLAVRELNITIAYTNNHTMDIVGLYRLTEHDVVIINMGLHYNERDHTLYETKALPILRQEIENLYGIQREDQTSNYTTTANTNTTATMIKPPILLVTETTPQHYQTDNGYYPDDDQIRKAGCGIRRNQPIYDSTINIRRDDWRNIALHKEFDLLVKANILSFIPINRPLQSQYDAHAGGREDCTHWCYPSGIQKYIHLMYYNAIRRRLKSEGAEYDHQTSVIEERPRHNNSQFVEDITWRLHPSLRNGDIVCFVRKGAIHECYRVERGYLRQYADYVTLKHYENIDLINNQQLGISYVSKHYPQIRLIEHPLEIGDYVLGEIIRLNAIAISSAETPYPTNTTAADSTQQQKQQSHQTQVNNKVHFDTHKSQGVVENTQRPKVIVYSTPAHGNQDKSLAQSSKFVKADKTDNKIIKNKRIENHEWNGIRNVEKRKPPHS